jgi:hypothetical protein
MAPLHNATSPIVLINHGDPNLFCVPAKWSSIALFYIANYLAHCVTVNTYPGETIPEWIIAIIWALFVPSSGVTRALDSIFRHSRLLRKEDDLQRAVRAGAICMVCRSKNWTPRVGDHIRGLQLLHDPSDRLTALRPSTPEEDEGQIELASPSTHK